MTATAQRLAGAGLASVLAMVFAPSAQAAGASYVALGDSYAAGVGSRASAVAGCYRSTLDYPHLVASAKGLTLDDQTCSGASVADVHASQLGRLDGSVRLVSVTIGGNDLGFVPVLTQCALPGWMSDCDGSVDRALVTLRTVLPARLAGLQATIRSKAPNASLVVTGYPRLFNGVDCHALTFFSPREMSRLNAIADELSSTLRRSAEEAGATYVDVRGRFSGHALCDAAPWINNLTMPIPESFHPNRLGHAAYAGAVVAATSGVGVPAASAKLRAFEAAPSAAGAPGAPGEAERANPVNRAPSRPSIEQVRAVAPGLSSATNLARAGAAGLPVERIAALEGALRQGTEAEARAALEELSRLDAEYSARRVR